MRLAFEEAARLTGAPVADVRAAFEEDDEPETLLERDGVHPSARGTALAARVIADAVRSVSQSVP